MRLCALIGLLACGSEAARECEIFSDCPSGQVCIMSVCTQLDAGTDSAADGAIPADCGNGMLDPGEECDQGTANRNDPDTCRIDCTFPRCGDSIVDTGEGCDDGNDRLFDGCSPECRVESSECVVVHSGGDRGSTFTAAPLQDGVLGDARALSTEHQHTEVVEHSLVRCGSWLYAATDEGILSLGLRDGVPIRGVIEPLANVRELACSGDTLFAVDPSSLRRYASTESGLEAVDMLELPFEMRNQTRVVPFARNDEIILVAISSRGIGSEPKVVRVSIGDALAVIESFDLSGSLRGKAASVSADGQALLANNPSGCAMRWELTAESAPSSACGLVEAIAGETILTADESAGSAWQGLTNGAVRFDIPSWTPTQTQTGFRAELLVEASSAFVAIGGDQITLLNDPPISVVFATSGAVRGAVVVPCAL